MRIDGHLPARVAGSAATPRAGAADLTAEERREVQRLRARDREVRAHEAAHKAAAGDLARGGARFEYERGPDGRQYAVGGEVSIDTSPVPNDPEATIRKMQRVRRAALAPAEPSAKDRQVAAAAARREAEARAERARAESGAAAGASPRSSAERAAGRYAAAGVGPEPSALIDLFA